MEIAQNPLLVLAAVTLVALAIGWIRKRLHFLDVLADHNIDDSSGDYIQ